MRGFINFFSLLIACLAAICNSQEIEETTLTPLKGLTITPFNIAAMVVMAFFTLVAIFIVCIMLDTDIPTKFEEKMPPIMKEY
ncbi:uncharacterized protein CMU_011230 [Cryptosporidium muris RN66]|uniref:Transmembrane protein n=1 Tax=Cryptosporidium muris (strain RN66) TaxID=441375 RepID=B6AIY3_CRYMR|nr:uncharacterized protein CMU_011230 [Cryptosporidium muris RN66]EEA08174.1 hypothetical protein, conserved [Cryptosporidium muris RN66]|eukprot:XP_002142523.1 hypothetical protein [Cryptosporidium muris RN66]